MDDLRGATVTDVPDIQYLKTADGAYIAYHVMGDGPVDLLVSVPGPICLDDQLDGWHCGRFLRELASFSRLIRFDRRGSGLSDPISSVDANTLEQWADDALAVCDAVGASRFAVYAEAGAAMFSVLLTASHPARVSHLVLFHGNVRFTSAPDYQLGRSLSEMTDMLIDRAPNHYGSGSIPVMEAGLMPSVANDESFRRWFVRSRRHAMSLGMWQQFWRVLLNADVRPALPAVSAPTLVLYRPVPERDVKERAEYIAQRIVGSSLKQLPGEDYFAYIGDSGAVVREIQQFVTGVRPAPASDRVLATVLFTDIVSSTERVVDLGDQRWKELLGRHDAVVSEEIARHRGQKVHSIGLGDGVLATFDGPARAVRCAEAIREDVRGLGLATRAGLHTGEIELRGEDVGGIAIHLAARVMGLANAGEVLVSRTVTDLVAGSGLEFEDRGEHELKGVPGKWAVYAVKA